MMVSINPLNQVPLAQRSPLRFLTATSLYDGHDASINIIRRLLQESGAEVIHLGHNRSVQAIVSAALQEDVDAIAISSYQGGHTEFFGYLLERLQQEQAAHIAVFGGGGGTISPDEACRLEESGITRIYTAELGQQLGLKKMMLDVMQRASEARQGAQMHALAGINCQSHREIGEMLTLIEQGHYDPARQAQRESTGRVIGISGTGGSGKSTLIDELLCKLLGEHPELNIAVLAIDPSRHRSGGALLGDRIRLNALDNPRVFMRSMATRRQHLATNQCLPDCIGFLSAVGFDLILVETAGTGQADAEIIDLVDTSVYVMTPEYGSSGQLEKIEMLDQADLIVLNKADKQGAEDGLRDICKQWRRNHQAFELPASDIPVYSVVASSFNTRGVARLYQALCRATGLQTQIDPAQLPDWQPLIPGRRASYLGQIVARHAQTQEQQQHSISAASRAWNYFQSLQILRPEQPMTPFQSCTGSHKGTGEDRLSEAYKQALDAIGADNIMRLQAWLAEAPAENETLSVDYNSPSHLNIPRIARPNYQDWGALLSFLLRENIPGEYPYTAGVFQYRNEREEPTRMFAGEGGPERTNRRFHYLASGQSSVRLSTAFDPIVLYGSDPDYSPDIYGRLGMSGVSVACLDDVKKLYSGFDLCDQNTSVSMTINGPAPVLLAWYIDAAIDQQVEKHLHANGHWQTAEQQIATLYQAQKRPQYQAELPDGHDGLGLALLGVHGDQLVDAECYQRIRADTLSRIRGTVQADILKEDQAQNECIYNLGFALKMMADVQEFFIQNRVKHYYSVSVSGYHIAEAGANPVTQLAFTLANAFTLVEYYLSRGLAVDDFAPNMSFFFSNGMDPEYAVIGRVARRIWAQTLRDYYQASERSQQLKYHIQTSGRSLHSHEIGFNDIRTTLQALYAAYDNCNSLHTNAYDEALTTPCEESVRRAQAIQMIINRELGLNRNQNPLQGAFIIDTLTDQVEAAVYREFERLDRRGGVLGAMETLYQRRCIQEQSLEYEQGKHDGSLPIVGINTFIAEGANAEPAQAAAPFRASREEKDAQIEALQQFKQMNRAQAQTALTRIKQTVTAGHNSFTELMESARYCSLGQISQALYEVGGRYERKI